MIEMRKSSCFLTHPWVVALGILILSVSSAVAQRPDKPMNVLFIAVDDLRPELNCYGATHMRTPNIDRLARRGVLFERAYCQQSVCAPSRNSLMTGLRPDALGIYDLNTFFRTKVPDVVTLSQWFKQNGYRSEGIGKIYHRGHGNEDDRQSWSIPSTSVGELHRSSKKVRRGDTTGLESDFPRINGKLLPYYSTRAPEADMTDALIAQKAVERLRALKDSTFFLAVGFIKPHLPFVAPRKYWEMYDPAKIEIPKRAMAEGMPDFAMANFGELRKYHGILAEGYLDDKTSRNLIHGYYAAVSMTDAQIGKVLDALEETGQADNTIIVLWGDHGFKLGNYGSWCKHSNLEWDTNAPLLISAPGVKGGVKTKSLAEFVDIYPTLCDLAGLEKPSHLEGLSLLPILKDPSAVVNQVAISQYPRGKGLDYDRKTELMGYSIRTDTHRYTRWQQYENPDEVAAVELYDQREVKNPWVNLADKPEYQEEVKKLDALMTRELGKYRLLKSTPAASK